MDGTAKGIKKGLVTDNHGEQHLARIAIFIVPGVRAQSFLCQIGDEER